MRAAQAMLCTPVGEPATRRREGPSRLFFYTGLTTNSHEDVSMHLWCDQIVMHPGCLVICQRRLVPHLPQKKASLPFSVERKKDV